MIGIVDVFEKSHSMVPGLVLERLVAIGLTEHRELTTLVQQVELSVVSGSLRIHQETILY